MDPMLLDMLWVVTAAGLVFLMQAGFLCLEAGMTRTKNSINVAIKNVADFGISALVFWAVGFGVMFGVTTQGWLGTSLFLPDLAPGEGASTGWTATFFLYQVMFCGTAVTIVSGAVAERVKFTGYLLMALTVALVYPVFGHWAWGGGLLDQGGWLGSMGFIDFAGSTVVHAVGGWFGLAACLVLGARLGRFNPDGSVNETNGSNVPLAMLGALLLWFGWIGFNGGSTFALDASGPGHPRQHDARRRRGPLPQRRPGLHAPGLRPPLRRHQRRPRRPRRHHRQLPRRLRAPGHRHRRGRRPRVPGGPVAALPPEDRRRHLRRPGAPRRGGLGHPRRGDLRRPRHAWHRAHPRRAAGRAGARRRRVRGAVPGRWAARVLRLAENDRPPRHPRGRARRAQLPRAPRHHRADRFRQHDRAARPAPATCPFGRPSSRSPRSARSPSGTTD